ncbi:hypothetical protein Ocin01_08190 [Orchesella cincta]|uniref:Uncharacterized protein n=1 Tax=Orchesella cincta TaxID=48709 RepID=A0A1D2MZS2_ORCCI|nr:hypothetical protein Ocin01_08190 [Orchesella cincta]
MQTSSAVIIGLLGLLCFVSYASAIRCYHCHSELNEDCGDPFDSPGNDSAILIDCDTLGDQNYTFCRKTVQIIELRPEKQSTRIIRSCSYLDDSRLLPDEGEDPADLRCYRRTGMWGVEVFYCGCHADGCNAASTVGVSSIVMLFLLFVCSYNRQ